MNFSNLVERMVPLVAELFATLKVNDPLRMDFASIAEKTVYDVVEVLRSEGLTNEEIAASLDLSIAGFYRKLKDLRETYEGGAAGSEARTVTLWERIYGHVLERSGGDPTRAVTFTAIERAFGFLTPDRLGSILRYLVRFGHLSVSGHGAAREYRVVVGGGAERGPSYHDAVVTLYRDGPLSVAELAARLEADEATCEAFVARLEAAGYLETTPQGDAAPAHRATAYHIEPESPEGYEAALWDHFQAVVRAICKKVRLKDHNARMHDVIGGTTFSFDLAADDPLYGEISGFLAETRVRMEDWMERALERRPDPDDRAVRVTIYTGQMVEDVE